MSEPDLWTQLISIGNQEREPIKEKISAVIQAARMPDKFYDRDLILLKEMGAIEVLKRMIGTASRAVPDSHDFILAMSRCPKME
jgi:hypothetical protein